MKVSLTRLGDSLLERLAPKATAKADQFECSYTTYRCRLPYCGGSGYYLSRDYKYQCSDGSYRWDPVGCCR
ncbi:hypothetical protein SUDANB121_00238 [Nocardiopsis dassonvillei]|uniref:hypothetical protein n=1 Tax=Nocardiopsis dassonvillei TaxID=2014 RepID=UPI003F548913